jgi:hypothetical protein
MTREELKAHCKKEIEMCEFWVHGKSEELDNNKIYQEHKLILELLEQEPCEDAISRQATVEFLEKHAETYEDVRVKMGFKASASLINNRNNLPPVTPTQNWIPTSERQPEENGNYLAFYRSSDGTAALEFVMVDHCNAGGGWLHEKSGKKSYKKVIAWMPLPKPYTAESEE